MRRLPPSLIVVLLVLRLGAAPTAQTPDLSGTWVLDPAASQVTDAAGLAMLGSVGTPDRLHVTHAANGDVVLQSEWNTSEARLFRPGAETVIPVGADDTMRVATRWDGAILVAEGSRPTAGGGSDILGVRRAFSLSPDGARLRVVATTTRAAGEATSTMVYVRLDTLGPCERWSEPCQVRN